MKSWNVSPWALAASALGCALLTACSGLGYQPKRGRLVREWQPASVSSNSVSGVASRATELRRVDRNTVVYRDERLSALDDEASPPLEQVGVGFPIRDWVSGYFDERGRYVQGSAWVRSEDGD